MTAGIYTNIYKDKNLSVTKQIIELLKKESVDFAVYNDISKELGIKCFGLDNETPPEIMITIGGDGTILGIIEYCSTHSIPILGVNLGKLGFLTEIEIKNIKNIAKILKSKNFNVEKRTMLEAEINGKKLTALNEIVVKRKDSGRMVLLDVYINGGFLDNYYCDGYIISTPTGSTAYSLSAGGSIISPYANVLALTPISSHSLHSRPVVISDEEETVLVIRGNGHEANIVADGKVCASISCGQKIHIKKSLRKALFVRLGNENFYSKLLSKLNTWSVTGEKDR